MEPFWATNTNMWNSSHNSLGQSSDSGPKTLVHWRPIVPVVGGHGLGRNGWTYICADGSGHPVHRADAELRHRPVSVRGWPGRQRMEPALPDTPPGEAGGRRSTRQKDPSELDPREMARGTRVAAARALQVSTGRSPSSSSSTEQAQGKAKGLGVVYVSWA